MEQPLNGGKGLRSAALAVPAMVFKSTAYNPVVAIDSSGGNAYALLKNGTLIGWGPYYPKAGGVAASGLLSFKASRGGRARLPWAQALPFATHVCTSQPASSATQHAYNFTLFCR